jgi:hypothetical protein
MPMLQEKGSQVVGFRVNAGELAKLDRLAETTKRSRGEVLRLLLALAQEPQTPDITLPAGAAILTASAEEVHA